MTSQPRQSPQEDPATALVPYDAPGVLRSSSSPQRPVEALTSEQAERLRWIAGNARSEATNAAYAHQWRSFCAWTAGNRLTAFPVSTKTAILYLDAMVAAGKRGSSINQALAAIRAVHQDHDQLPGAREALAGLSSRRMTNAVASLHRVIGASGGNRVAKPRAFSQGEVTSMTVGCPASPSGIQDRAVLLLGVNAGLRASEYVALTLADLTFDETGVDVFVRDSKTDQMGVGENVFVGRLPAHQALLCPVRAMERHIAKNRALAAPSSPLFLAFRRGGASPHLIGGATHALTREAITNLVVRCATRAELPESVTSRISSHSLRHTFITQAFTRGVSPVDIARVSRHRNMAVLAGYNQTDRREAAVSPRLWN